MIATLSVYHGISVTNGRWSQSWDLGCNMLKKLLKSPAGNRVMGWVIAAIIRLLMVTIRWRRSDRAAFAAALQFHHGVADTGADTGVIPTGVIPTGVIPTGVIVVFWHERIMAMPYLWPRGDRVYALQSTHADGRMMAHAIRQFGIQTIWGSTNRLAHSALRGLARVLTDGCSVAMTPDGPRGPAHVAAVGPVALARLTGCPILPVCWSVDRQWRGGGWDRTIVPKPFARGRLLIGDPIFLTATGANGANAGGANNNGKADLEAACRRLEQALDQLGAEADALHQ